LRNKKAVLWKTAVLKYSSTVFLRWHYPDQVPGFSLSYPKKGTAPLTTFDDKYI